MSARSTHATDDTAKVGGNKAWLTERERGALFAIRALVFWASFFGRTLTQAFVSVLALYYALFDRHAREASRRWLERVHGEPASFARVYGHVRCFAQVTLDRLFFLRGETKGITVNRNGNHHLEALTRERKGAILLGAHLGSFEAMRASGAEERFPVHIVGHFANARMINAVLEALDPEMANRVIHIGDDPIGLALTLRARIEEGAMLALLGDRVGLNDKTITVDFFGGKAQLPTGPLLLASALKCPVYLVFGLYFAPNRYELFCEPFASRVVLPRNRRQEALEALVQGYATRLEAYCKRAPDNWFNFYDFWEASGS